MSTFFNNPQAKMTIALADLVQFHLICNITDSNNVIVHHGDLSIIEILANLLLVSSNLIITNFESYCLNKE